VSEEVHIEDRPTSDRPTDQPVIWEHFKGSYIRKGSSDPLPVWFYGGVFGVGWRYFQFEQFNRRVGEKCAWSQSKVFLVLFTCSLSSDSNLGLRLRTIASSALAPVMMSHT